MPSGQVRAVVRQFHQLFGHGTTTGIPERHLLERFATTRDEIAFEALIARHGPMVQGVCRRVLRDPRDVEDAFQATFLVLAQKASAIRNPELLGNWLYGVAHRVATRARTTMLRRRAEDLAAVPEPVAPEDDPDLFELSAVLDQELRRLPEKYRAPIVLCHLEGQTHEEAAARLRWPVGTVRGRLARGRALLRGRLTRRGVTPTSAALVALLARDVRAALPETLVGSTVRAAITISQGAAAGAVSATALSLANSVVRTMAMSKLKLFAGTLFAAGAITGGAVATARQDSAASRPELPAADAAPAVNAPLGAQVPDLPPPNRNRPARRGEAREALDLQTAETARSRPPDPKFPRANATPSPNTNLENWLKETQDGVNEALKTTTMEITSLRTRLETAQAHAARLRALKQALESPLPAVLQEVALEQGNTLIPTETLGPAVGGVPGDPPLAANANNVIPPFESNGPPAEPRGVKPGDRIRIEVLEALPGRPITGIRPVRADGTISVDFYGDLQVAGLTRTEIKTKLVNLLRKHLTEESLGLVDQDPSAAGGRRKIDPADTDRVYVDDAPLEATATDLRLRALERKLDQMLQLQQFNERRPETPKNP
jgi:RNA polymerase sigma factor (sigma-70 family)